MSEYQYYEFQAVDRPLTQAEMAELKRYSSRARITSTGFVNEYNWGDFKGNPERWMENYFDAFLYLANWGSRQLMVRVPDSVLDPQILDAFCTGRSFSYRRHASSVILSFESEDEEHEWVEGDGWLASLLPLRAGLMAGDRRSLYLGWLLAVQAKEVDENVLEPPVPPGLGEPDASLERLVEFLRIDPDLVTAAAELSPGQPAGLSKREIESWIATLPNTEKDGFLARLIKGDDPCLALELRQRAGLHARGGSNVNPVSRRTVGDLIARAESTAESRKRREAKQRALEKAERERQEAEKRKKRLEALVGKEVATWMTVDKLIATKQPGRYDEAVSLLKDLRDVADMQSTAQNFRSRMARLCSEHSRKPALLERLRKANLV